MRNNKFERMGKMKKFKKVLLSVAMSLIFLVTSLTVGGQPVMAADAPTVISAETTSSGSSLIVSFNKSMAYFGTIKPEGFSITVDGISRAIPASSLNNIYADNTKYTLGLSYLIQPGQTVILSYEPGTVKAEASDGGVLESFSGYPVINNVTGAPPFIFTAITDTNSALDPHDGTHISLSFNKAMLDPPAAPGGFSINVDGVDNAVAVTDIDHDYTWNYYLTLATPIRGDQLVTVSYIPGTVKSADGGLLGTVDKKTVQNHVPLKLTSISLSGSPSNYTYSEAAHTYNEVKVAGSVESITVTPTGIGVIYVDEKIVASGSESEPIALTPGVEKKIIVEARLAARNEYGHYKPNTYTIYITRGLIQETPTFNPAPGAVAIGSTVAIISDGADAIYYTTNGDAPTTASTNQAVTPLVINSAGTVKAIAVKDGKANSIIGSAAYTQAAAGLTGLGLSGSPSNYSFVGSTYTYNDVTVANSVDSIIITPTGTGTETITVDGKAVISGTASAAIGLEPGTKKTVSVIVSETGKSASIYTIDITRNLPAPATPTFVPDSGALVFDAELQIVSSGAEHIYYTTDGTDPVTSVMGTTLEYNDGSRPVINRSMTVKAVAVAAGSDDSAIGSATYTQAATADLTGLELSGSPSNYSFAGSTYTYGTVTVANAVDSITLTPTGNGTITVTDGTKVISENTPAVIDLTAGVKRTITVTATETGKSAKIYTINITRLNTAPEMPTFSPASGEVAFGTRLEITSSGADRFYYTTDGSDPATSETGTTKAYYKKSGIVIDRSMTVKAVATAVDSENSAIGSAIYTQAATADLTGLELSGSPSNYSFAGSTYIYDSVKVANSVDSIILTPTGTGFITVDGTAVISGTTSAAIALTAGTEKIISVIATELGKSAKTYTIKITRANAYYPYSGNINANTEELAPVDPESVPTGSAAPEVKFNDVADTAWYRDAVYFIAARGITQGTGGGNFSPEAKLTRAEFLTMVMRAYGIEADENPTDNFSDAGNTYYTGYLAAAKRLGIAEGIGNNMFAPDREITRQEMFTLLYNALKGIGKLPAAGSVKALADFSDADAIADWAKEAMAFFVGTGSISGNDGMLNPEATATRAQMAQVLYNLLTK